jgi:hypothetical protein
MSLANNDLVVFNRQLRDATMETIADNIDLFNSASNNVLRMSTGMQNPGDYTETSKWKALTLTRTRDAYSNASISAINMTQILDRSVKIACGTPLINLDPSGLEWTGQQSEEESILIGRELGKQMIAQALHKALLSVVAATSQVAAVVHDATGASPDTLTANHMVIAASKFGDRSAAIRAWLTHSAPLTDFYRDNVANQQQLFTYDTINVIGDPFGRRFIQSDQAALVNGADYYVMGLVPEGVHVMFNDDFRSEMLPVLGNQNLGRQMQVQWSLNVSVKGFAWDKTNGGHSPTDAAIATATNWDRYATSHKDLAGVMLKANLKA